MRSLRTFPYLNAHLVNCQSKSGLVARNPRRPIQSFQPRRTPSGRTGRILTNGREARVSSRPPGTILERPGAGWAIITANSEERSHRSFRRHSQWRQLGNRTGDRCRRDGCLTAGRAHPAASREDCDQERHSGLLGHGGIGRGHRRCRSRSDRRGRRRGCHEGSGRSDTGHRDGAAASNYETRCHRPRGIAGNIAAQVGYRVSAGLPRLTERRSSEDLCEDLRGLENRPWAQDGIAINPRRLSQLLKPFGIAPKSVRLGRASTPKGYTAAQFEDPSRGIRSRRQAQHRHSPEKPGFPALASRKIAPLLRNVLRFGGRELRRNQGLLRCGG